MGGPTPALAGPSKTRRWLSLDEEESISTASRFNSRTKAKDKGKERAMDPPPLSAPARLRSRNASLGLPASVRNEIDFAMMDDGDPFTVQPDFISSAPPLEDQSVPALAPASTQTLPKATTSQANTTGAGNDSEVSVRAGQELAIDTSSVPAKGAGNTLPTSKYALKLRSRLGNESPATRNAQAGGEEDVCMSTESDTGRSAGEAAEIDSVLKKGSISPQMGTSDEAKNTDIPLVTASGLQKTLSDKLENLNLSPSSPVVTSTEPGPQKPSAATTAGTCKEASPVISDANKSSIIRSPQAQFSSNENDLSSPTGNRTSRLRAPTPESTMTIVPQPGFMGLVPSFKPKEKSASSPRQESSLQKSPKPEPPRASAPGEFKTLESSKAQRVGIFLLLGV